MARRRRRGAGGSPIEDMAVMPWRVCLVLAIASYYLLHAWAGMPPPKFKPGAYGISKSDSLVIVMVIATIQSMAQYVVPMLLLAAGIVSAGKQARRKRVFEETFHRQDAAAIDGMSWQRFEMLVAEGFRQRGFQVEETGGGGADGGVDLVLRKPASNGSEMFLVQCKHWRAYRVGVSVVRELYGAMAACGAAGGFVVTSGRFTEEAVRFASGRNLELIDGAGLRALLASAEPPAAAPTQQEPYLDEPPAPPSPSPSLHCPLCGKLMVRRVARRGPGMGQEFYGCSGYPECRGTRKAL